MFTWDQRSLLVPLTYFLERPIRNWTRTSSQLLDTAFLYVDYGVPVEAIRKAAREIVEGSPRWDGRAFAVQVTELAERRIDAALLDDPKHRFKTLWRHPRFYVEENLTGEEPVD